MEGRKRKERVSPLCILGEGERGKWRGAFAPTPPNFVHGCSHGETVDVGEVDVSQLNATARAQGGPQTSHSIHHSPAGLPRGDLLPTTIPVCDTAPPPRYFATALRNTGTARGVTQPSGAPVTFLGQSPSPLI